MPNDLLEIDDPLSGSEEETSVEEPVEVPALTPPSAPSRSFSITDLQKVRKDPDFLKLPPQSKRRVFRRLIESDTDWQRLDPQAQERVSNRILAQFPDDAHPNDLYLSPEEIKQKFDITYQYGGDPNSKRTDCSGFTCQIYKRNGVNLDKYRTAQDQWSKAPGQQIGDKNAIQPGDQLFWTGTNGHNDGTASHTGYYLGRGPNGERLFVHNSSTKGGVTVSNLDTYGLQFLGAKRYDYIDKIVKARQGEQVSDAQVRGVQSPKSAGKGSLPFTPSPPEFNVARDIFAPAGSTGNHVATSTGGKPSATTTLRSAPQATSSIKGVRDQIRAQQSSLIAEANKSAEKYKKENPLLHPIGVIGSFLRNIVPGLSADDPDAEESILTAIQHQMAGVDVNNAYDKIWRSEMAKLPLPQRMAIISQMGPLDAFAPSARKIQQEQAAKSNLGVQALYGVHETIAPMASDLTLPAMGVLGAGGNALQSAGRLPGVVKGLQGAEKAAALGFAGGMVQGAGHTVADPNLPPGQKAAELALQGIMAMMGLHKTLQPHGRMPPSMALRNALRRESTPEAAMKRAIYSRTRPDEQMPSNVQSPGANVQGSSVIPTKPSEATETQSGVPIPKEVTPSATIQTQPVESAAAPSLQDRVSAAIRLAQQYGVPVFMNSDKVAEGFVGLRRVEGDVNDPGSHQIHLSPKYEGGTKTGEEIGSKHDPDYVILHELGHVLADSLVRAFRKGAPDVTTLAGQLGLHADSPGAVRVNAEATALSKQRYGEFISEDSAKYAARPDEMAADMIAEYLADPAKFSRAAPTIYRILDEILGNQNRTGEQATHNATLQTQRQPQTTKTDVRIGETGKTRAGRSGGESQSDQLQGAPGKGQEATQVSQPEAVGVVSLNPRDIQIDPERFQFKVGASEKGTTGSLSSSSRWRPELAGTLLVWKDPSNGKTYVVNGHNRLSLANRSGASSVDARYINDIAPTPEIARRVGAIANIAEGRGTPIDAAKLFREEGVTPEGLRAEGVSMTEANARNGLALARLPEGLWRSVFRGEMPVERGVAIGEGGLNQGQMMQLHQMVESAEKRGKRLTPGEVGELGKIITSAGEAEVTTSSLFGDETKSMGLAVEMARLVSALKYKLSKDARLFGFVSRGERATELERGGNKIDIKNSKQLAQQSAQVGEIFDRLAYRSGPINNALRDAAARIAKGENPHGVQEYLYERTSTIVRDILSGKETERGAGHEVPPTEQPHTATDLFSESESAPYTPQSVETATPSVEPVSPSPKSVEKPAENVQVPTSSPQREGMAAEKPASAELPTARESVKAFQEESRTGKALEALDALEQAAIERFKNRNKGRLSSGIDPLDLADYALAGAAKIGKGIVRFADWSAEMVRDFGEGVKPHLESLWEYSKRAYDNHVRPSLGENAPIPEENAPKAAEVQPKPRRVKEPEAVTGTKNAITEQERADRGMTPVERQAYTNMGKAYAEGRDAVESNTINPRSLAVSVAKKPRPLSALEVGALGYDRAKIIEEHNALIAKADKTTDPDKLAAIRADMSLLEEAFDFNDQALVKGGREQSAAFNARKMQIKADYSLLAVKNRMKLANPDSPLTPREDAAITHMTARLAEVEKLLAAQTIRIKELEIQRSVEREVRQNALEERKTGRKRAIADIQKQREEIGKSISAKLGRAQSGIPADILPDVAKLVKTYIAEGVTRAEDLVDHVHTYLSQYIDDLDKRDVRDAISGYGKVAVMNQSEAAKRLRDFNRQLKLISAIEDAEAKQKPLKSGLQREPESSEVKALRARLKEAMLRSGLREERSGMTDEQKLKSYKTRLNNEITALEGRLKRGELENPPKKPPMPLDDEANKLKLERDRLKKQIEEEIARRKKPHWSDFIPIVQRFNILTGVSTLGKLTAAAGARIATTPIEEVTGAVAGRLPVLRDVAKKAPREGGFSMKAERDAFLSFFHKTMAGEVLPELFEQSTAQAALQKLRTGSNALDVRYGTEHTPAGSGKVRAFNNFMEVPGRIHGAIKTPAQRAEFFRALEKRTEHAQKQGMDLRDPDVQDALGAMAYIDSQRAILMNDNNLVKWYRGQLMNLDKIGTPPARALSAAARLTFPIVRVPTNYISEAMNYGTLGTKGAIELIYHTIQEKGVKNLTPEQADKIMRSVKKGLGIGGFMMALGYYQPDSIKGTGYYQEGDADKGPEDLHPGDIELFGLRIPHNLAHIPALEAFQIGATIRRAQEERRHGESPSGWEQSRRVAVGLAEQIPFFEEPVQALRATEGESALGKYAGDRARSLVEPLLLQQYAASQDTALRRRVPRGFSDQMKMGIPGYREDVPTAKGKGDAALRRSVNSAGKTR